MKTKHKVKAKPVQSPVKQRKGFAVISRARRVEIARMGGMNVSRDRAHMAELGRLGGLATQKHWRFIKKEAKKA